VLRTHCLTYQQVQSMLYPSHRIRNIIIILMAILIRVELRELLFRFLIRKQVVKP